MATETIIDLIRHGEPIGGQRLRGSQDDPLTELGWQQMRESIGANQPWSRLVSSPLLRCHDFAQKLSLKTSVKVDVNHEFREICFGTWEGLSITELMKSEPKALRDYWQDPENNAPQGAERMTKFVRRVHTAWDQLIVENQGEHTLLICHGGVIRAILTRVLGMPNDKLWNFDVPYANATRLVYHHFPDGGETAQLKFHQASFPSPE
jgi:broad specificity phosphatase PhoE